MASNGASDVISGETRVAARSKPGVSANDNAAIKTATFSTIRYFLASSSAPPSRALRTAAPNMLPKIIATNHTQTSPAPSEIQPSATMSLPACLTNHPQSGNNSDG